MGMPQGQGQMMYPQGQGLMPGGMMGGAMMPGMMPGFPQMSMMTEQQLVNPGLNDAPLEFNTNKNKPPMPILGADIDERGGGSMGSANQFNKEGKRDRGELRRTRFDQKDKEARLRPDRSKEDRLKDSM